MRLSLILPGRTVIYARLAGKAKARATEHIGSSTYQSFALAIIYHEDSGSAAFVSKSPEISNTTLLNHFPWLLQALARLFLAPS